jgi:hypothetical protein
MSELKSSSRSVASLASAEMRAMYELMGAHYEAVPWERFEKDLSSKDEVLVLHDAGGNLRGFTTIAWNPSGHCEEGDVMFSGDTIIDRCCWGTQELVRAFCRRAGEWQARSGRRLFWLLISKGYRTFLYLPLFARRFHPHPQNLEIEWAAIASRVAAVMFGDAWKADEGVIRFAFSQGHLREELADIKPEGDKHPMIRFFLERNPGYRLGEELLCLAEMTESNLKRGALTAFREGLAIKP